MIRSKHSEAVEDHEQRRSRIGDNGGVTAISEILGCYLPYLRLRQGKSPRLIVPAAISLAIFAWLLTLHPTASGRTYAAYGGVYISMSILWLWQVDKIIPTRADILGVGICLAGMAVIMFSPR